MYFTGADVVSSKPFRDLSQEALLKLVKDSSSAPVESVRITPRSGGSVSRDYRIWRPLLFAGFIYFPVFAVVAVWIAYLHPPLFTPAITLAALAGLAKGYSSSKSQFDQDKGDIEASRSNAGTKELHLDLEAGCLVVRERFTSLQEERTESIALSKVRWVISFEEDTSCDAPEPDSIQIALQCASSDVASAWARDVLGRSVRAYFFSSRATDQKEKCRLKAIEVVAAINDRLIVAGHSPMATVNHLIPA